MPIPNQPLRNNFSHFDYSSLNFNPMPLSSSHSPNHNTNSHTSTTTKSLSYPQLFAIYNEIVNEWSKIQWLIFVDNHRKTYLTLDSNTNGFVTVQMAINQYHHTSGSMSLLSLPECLLIRTKSQTQGVFLPNSIISIENLCDKNIAQNLFKHKLMAIVCHSNETNSKLMFYKDFHSNFWYIYYDQSISSHSHSNILSNEERHQLELFIQEKDQINHIDLSKFTCPLSALCNHPIVYVYIPAKTNENN
jgi:hypothetical protein